MIKIFSSVLQVLAITVIFIILFIFPTIIIPVSESLQAKISAEQMEYFFPLLFLFSTYLALSYWLLVKNTAHSRSTLFIRLVLANLIIFPIMIYLESIFWLENLEITETSEYGRIFLRFTITFILFSGFIVFFSKKGQSITTPDRFVFNRRIVKSLVFLGMVYLIVYNLFGYFVAWQFEATRIYYTGSSELRSFFSMLVSNFTDLKFVAVHFIRGLLFAVAGYLLYSLVSGGKTTRTVVLALIFGAFGFQIILPGPIFPDAVRIAHFIETTTSMLLYGAIVGFYFSMMDQPVDTGARGINKVSSLLRT